MHAPLPRFRIYTRPSTYLHILGEYLFGKAEKGDSVVDFERAISESVGVAEGVAMPTARTAIYYVLKNLIQPGQEVILSPITISDVINMVICAGGIPVFADVERETCNIDPLAIERLITPKTGAILITHLHGLVCDMTTIVKTAAHHKIPLVEDCAQAFSARYQGKPVGSFGRAAVFSFGMYKNVNSFFGGMVVTDDKALASLIRKQTEKLPFQDKALQIKKIVHAFITDISTFPLIFKTFTFWIFRVAYLKGITKINNMVIVDRLPLRKSAMPDSLKCRMRPMQARICLGQLSQVENNNRDRIRKAKIYHQGLSDIPELILPPLKEDGSHIYTYFPIQFPDRHALMRFAMQNNRDIVLSHYHNCAALECFKEYYRDCPNAKEVSRTLIYLPTYPRYSLAEVERNVEVLRKFFHK